MSMSLRYETSGYIKIYLLISEKRIECSLIPLSLLIKLSLPSCPRSCSLQPEPEWHRPPDVPGGYDITAGGRGGVRGRRGCAAGRRQPELP